MTFAYANSQYGRPRQVQVIATESDYFRIKSYNLTSGRLFSPQEAQLGTPVVVIGTEVASHFFRGLDPIGRELRIGGTPYAVIGLLEKQGNVFGFSLDRMVIGPYKSTLSRVTNPRGDIDALVVQAPTREGLDDALESVREVMRGFRRLPPARPDNFALETSDAALSFFNELKGKLILFGTALPAIGLVVGAMVIMNIMLVAVAERTREIGIRKALGAKRRDILSQFLVESATLSLFGGSHRHRARDRAGQAGGRDITAARRASRRGPSRSRSSSAQESGSWPGCIPRAVRLGSTLSPLFVRSSVDAPPRSADDHQGRGRHRARRHPFEQGAREPNDNGCGRRRVRGDRHGCCRARHSR